jgi:hypothetical protein
MTRPQLVHAENMRFAVLLIFGPGTSVIVGHEKAPQGLKAALCRIEMSFTMLICAHYNLSRRNINYII